MFPQWREKKNTLVYLGSANTDICSMNRTERCVSAQIMTGENTHCSCNALHRSDLWDQQERLQEGERTRLNEFDCFVVWQIKCLQSERISQIAWPHSLIQVRPLKQVSVGRQCSQPALAIRGQRVKGGGGTQQRLSTRFNGLACVFSRWLHS